MAEQIKMAEKNNAIIDRAIETLKHHKIKFSPQKILEK